MERPHSHASGIVALALGVLAVTSVVAGLSVLHARWLRDELEDPPFGVRLVTSGPAVDADVIRFDQAIGSSHLRVSLEAPGHPRAVPSLWDASWLVSRMHRCYRDARPRAERRGTITLTANVEPSGTLVDVLAAGDPRGELDEVAACAAERLAGDMTMLRPTALLPIVVRMELAPDRS